MTDNKSVKVTLTAVVSDYQAKMAAASATTSKLAASGGVANAKLASLDDKAKGAAKSIGTLAAGAGALAGTAVVMFLKNAVSAASDLNETVSKTGQVFGSSSLPALEKFADGAAKSLGQSKQAALDAVSSFGVFGKSAGLAGSDLVGFSTQLTQLASDMASFSNTTPEDAVMALSAALRGESEPIRRYGVLLDDATLRNTALRMGLIQTTTQALTPQQKVLAAHAEIMRQTADAQGDFARTSTGLANSQRILAAEWQNTQAQLGQALLPAMTELVHLLSGGLSLVQATAQAFGAIPGPVKAAAAAVVAFHLASKGLDLGKEKVAATAFGEALKFAGMAAERAGGGFKGAAAGFSTFTRGMASTATVTSGLKSAGSGLMSMLGGPWGLAFAGATLAVTSWMQAQDNARQAAEAFSGTLDAQTGAVTKASAEWVASQLQMNFAAEDWQKVQRETGLSIREATDAIVAGGDQLTAFQAKFDALQTAANDGQFLEVTNSTMQALGNTIAAAARDTAAGREQAALHRQALSGEAGAAQAVTSAVKTQEDAQATLNQTIKDAKTALDKYIGSLADAGMLTLSGREVIRRYESALDDATAALKKNGAGLDVTTEKGRANQAALDDIAKAALDVAKSTYEQTGSQDKYRSSLERSRSALIAAAKQMGMGETAAAAYADSVLKIPPAVSTKVTLDDRDAKAKRAALLRPATLTIYAHVSGSNLDKLYGVIGRQDGGIVKRADGGIDGNGAYVERVPQVARRRNILWGETDIPWESYISGKPEMRGRNMGILRETLRLMKVSPNEFASLQFANGAYLAASRPNVAAAVGAAPSISVTVENPWTGEQVQAVVRSVVVDGIAQQARTQRRHSRAGVLS